MLRDRHDDGRPAPTDAGGIAPSAVRSRAAALRAPLAALAFFTLAGVLLLWPAVAGSAVVSSSGAFVARGPFPSALSARARGSLEILSDQTQQFSPWLRYAADSFRREGRIPLWKNTALCGAPFVGNGQSSVFYPTHLLAILFGAPIWIHTFESLAKLVAGAFCAWLLARHLGLSFLASLLCGAVFGFGGFQVVFLQHPLTNVSVLLPLLLLAADAVALRPTAARLAGLALVAGCQHLGGHPETAFHCQVAAFVLGVLRCVSLRREPSGPAAWKRVACLCGGLLLGAGIGAIQSLPVLEYLGESDVLRERTLRNPHFAEVRRLQSLAFLGALLAAAWCLRRLARSARGPVWPAVGLFLALVAALLAGVHSGLYGVWLQWLSADWYGDMRRYFGPGSYVGQNGAFAGAALPLAMLGLLAGRPRGPVRVAGVVGVLGLLIGFNAPIVSELLERLPVFALAANGRLLLLALLACAVLAGFGLDALGRLAREPALRLRLLLGVLAPVAAAWVVVAGGLLAGLPPLTTPNVPTLASTRDFKALLLPSSWHARLLPYLPPYPPGEHVELPPEDVEVFVGIVSSERPIGGLRLVYGREDVSVVGRMVPVSALGLPDFPVPVRPDVSVFAFEALVPRADVPPERPVVRVWVAFRGGGAPGVSDRLVRPDDPGPEVLPFPARPGGDLAWLPLVCMGLVLLLAVGFLDAQGAALTALRLALLLVVCASLAGFVSNALPLAARDLVYPLTPPLRTLQTLAPDARMLSQRSWRFAPEIPTWYGIRDVNGYDALHPWRIAAFLRAATDVPGGHSALQTLPQRDDPDLALLGLMAVKMLGDVRDPAPAASPLPLTKFRLDHEPGTRPYLIATNPHYLPRARLVSGAVIEPDDERALELLRGEEFPRERSVVLAEGEAREPAPGDAGTARIVLDRPEQVRVAIAPTGPARLVLADTHFPGWIALVDGQPRAIERTNVAFRSVAVEPGDRMVEFRYEPRVYRAGVLVSLACGLLAAALCLSSFLRLRRRSAAGGVARGPAPPAS